MTKYVLKNPYAAILNDNWNIDIHSLPVHESFAKTQHRNNPSCNLGFGDYGLILTKDKAELSVKDKNIAAEIDWLTGIEKDVPDSLSKKMWKTIKVVTNGTFVLPGVCTITKK